MRQMYLSQFLNIIIKLIIIIKIIKLFARKMIHISQLTREILNVNVTYHIKYYIE